MSTTSEIIRIVNRIIGQAKKIVDLPSAPSVAGTDLIEVSIGGVSYKATASQVGSGGSGVVQTIVAGAGITVDATDPANPIVSATGSGAGTVTSVSVGNLSPLFTSNVADPTTTPAVTFTLVNQNANLVYAGPSTGVPAAPTFRSLVAADIPDLSAVYYPAGNPSGYITGNQTITLSGEATGSGATSIAVTLSNAAVIAKVLTGFTSGAGTVAATDTILQAIQKLDGNDALSWKVTGTTTLSGSGGAPTIANAGNNLTFSGAGTHSFSSTSATVAGNFTATSTYTVPAGGAVSAFGSVFNGTITGKGTANDLLCMVRVNGALNNSTGSGVTHVSLRVDTTHGGSVNPSASIAIQAIAGHSMSTAEIFRGVNSSGQTRYQMFADGHHVWTQTVTGSDFGGSMSTNAANGAGHLAMSFQLSGSATTAHTHFGVKATGGMTTNATNATYNSFWDARSLVVNHTGFTGYGFRYAPVVTGTQSGTETLYAFIAESGLSGFGIATPTARLQTRGLNNAVAFLAEDDAGNSIASFGESGGARVIGFFGATPVVQQTMGAATAGAAYTATEQTMLQAVYDAVRNIGIGT